MMTLRTEAVWEPSSPAMRLKAGKHEFYADEAASAGGTDRGPNPLQYMLGSIAGCFIAMGRMVAGEMGMKFEKIGVRAEGDLNPVGLTGKDSSIRPGCQQVRLTVEVATQEPKEKVAEWLKLVEARCPVRDCIANVTPVNVTMK